MSNKAPVIKQGRLRERAQTGDAFPDFSASGHYREQQTPVIKLAWLREHRQSIEGFKHLADAVVTVSRKRLVSTSRGGESEG